MQTVNTATQPAPRAVSAKVKSSRSASLQTTAIPHKMFTKAFTTGGSQAVRVPKAFRFKSNNIQIERNAAGQVVLTEVDENAEAKRLLELQAMFKYFADNPLTDEDDFVLPPRELADFRSPFDKIAGQPPLTFVDAAKTDLELQTSLTVMAAP